MLATFRALGMALAPKLVLALALVGAFVLAVMALLKGSVIAVSVFAAYCVLVPLPLILSELWPRLKARE